MASEYDTPELTHDQRREQALRMMARNGQQPPVRRRPPVDLSSLAGRAHPPPPSSTLQLPTSAGRPTSDGTDGGGGDGGGDGVHRPLGRSVCVGLIGLLVYGLFQLMSGDASAPTPLNNLPAVAVAVSKSEVPSDGEEAAPADSHQGQVGVGPMGRVRAEPFVPTPRLTPPPLHEMSLRVVK